MSWWQQVMLGCGAAVVGAVIATLWLLFRSRTRGLRPEQVPFDQQCPAWFEPDPDGTAGYPPGMVSELFCDRRDGHNGDHHDTWTGRDWPESKRNASLSRAKG